MSNIAFEDVLRATLERTERSDPLERLARDSGRESRGWMAVLADWMGLAPGDTAPKKIQIVARLTLEIEAIDRLIGDQLDAILHHPSLQELEASWRGLFSLHELRAELVGNKDEMVELRVLDLSWRELTRDFERAPEFDMTRLFELVYSEELDTPGGSPFGVLLGNYTITHRRSAEHRDDIGTLRGISQVAAASFCPFVAAADPSLFELSSFTELERPMDLGRTFRSAEYVAWNSLRKTDDARFTALTLPRILMRRPFRDDPTRTDGFRYEENVATSPHADHPSGSAHLWGNAIWAFGEVLVRAFVETGWMAAIRGVEKDVEGRGLVTRLVQDWHPTELTGVLSKGSLEIQLTDALENELGELGFIPLVQCHGTGLSAFYGNQSIQDWRSAFEGAQKGTPAAANAKLSSMLQYMFCVSRFAHYVKLMARDKVGSYTNANDLQAMLASWLIQYATANAGASAEAQARFPLRDARVEVREKPAQPGAYACTVHLQPHYQLDQLATSISLSTDIYTGYEL